MNSVVPFIGPYMSLSKKLTTTVALSDSILASFQPSKGLSYHEGASITSLDFDTTGQYLVSAGVDKSIQVYDCYKGSRHKEVQSQKYGAHLARFTHSFECLYASTPLSDGQDPDHSIRYLSLSTKSYLRYFKGHKDQVLQLEVNPLTDTFMTSAADHTVKFWDLRTSSPTGNIGISTNCVVAYDPRGIVFVTASNSNHDGQVSFYDANSYEKGPFLVSDIDSGDELWTKVEFSNNGRYLLISTNTYKHYILDAILGKLAATIMVSGPCSWPTLDYISTGSTCFTPDGKSVLAGMTNGNVAVFTLLDLKQGSENRDLHPFTTLKSNHSAAKIVSFNPKLLTFASADDKVILWSTNR